MTTPNRGGPYPHGGAYCRACGSFVDFDILLFGTCPKCDWRSKPTMTAPAPSPIKGPTMQDQFIPVPETTLPGGLIVPAFQVGQYACTRGEDGKAAVKADAAPWVSINFKDAQAACEKSGYKLITETQWLALAWNACQQDANWTKGQIWKGKLFRGLRKGNVGNAQPGTYEPEDPKERRWMVLSNGERICDLNGNVWQWVFDDVQGKADGTTTIIKADSISLTTAPYPREKKGMGWRPDGQRDWSGDALLRGSAWCSESVASAFCLGYDLPNLVCDSIGFRCTQPIR